MGQTGSANDDSEADAAGSGRGAAAARMRRHHPLVLIVTGLNIAFALLYSLIVPLYRGPDESLHVDMIRHYRADSGEPSPVATVPIQTVARNVYRDGSLERAYRPPLALRTRDAIPRSSRPTFEALGIPETAMPNQMSQHPPLYYAVVAGVSSFVTGITPVGLWSYDREVYFYRLFSILAIAPLALLASAALLGMKCSKRVAAVGAAFTMLIPQMTFVGSVVNNDGFVILFAALSVAAGLHYLGGASRRSAWVAAGAGAAVALTKSTGAPIAAWAVLVVVIGAYERWRRGDRRDAVTALGGAVVLAGIGGLWYVRNLVKFHTAQPAPQGHRHIRGSVRLSFGSFLPTWLDRISQTFWGMPARRLGIALPWWVSHALSVVTLAAVVITVVMARRLWKFTLPLVAVCLVQIGLLLRSDYRANHLHAPGPDFPGLQGRYIYALIVPFAVFVAVAVGALARRWSRAVPGVAVGMLALGCVLHVTLAAKMLSQFWEVGDATFSERMRAVFAWSPLPGPLTGVVLALPLVMIVVALVAAGRGLRSPRGARAQ